MHKKSFAGKFINLEQIGDFIGLTAENAGLDETAVYAVQLAVDEACTNIIEHAYGGESLGEISISTEVTANRFIVEILDHGQPFDPDSIPVPKTNVPLEEIQPRGVGLFLMRKMMDEVRFSFEPSLGNTLTMVKYL